MAFLVIVKVCRWPYNDVMEQHTYALPRLDSMLLDQIIFEMENQDEEGLLDKQEGVATHRTALQPGEDRRDGRFVPLPAWTSADGYNLMVRFTDKVVDQGARKELAAALSRGHGVFRAFKNVLQAHPDVLQKWYGYKEHEMEKVVTAWYRSLKGIVAGPDDGAAEGGYADVLLEDFSVSEKPLSSLDAGLFGRLVADGRVQVTLPPDASLLVVEDPEGEACGMLVYVLAGQAAHVVFYGIDAPWRGLGLFRLLFDALARIAAKRSVSSILFDAAGRDIGISRIFDGIEGVETSFVTLAVPVSQYRTSRTNS